jgi:hypothetical protein
LFDSEITDAIAIDGISVTIKHRTTEYYGDPSATAGSGGSLSAGVYYYRANPVVSSVEQKMGRDSKVTVGASGKVTLTLPNLGVGVTFNVYRSTVNTLSYPASSLVGSSQAAGSFVDDGSAPSAGTPEEAAANPYVVWTPTATKCIRRSRRPTTDIRDLQGGVGPTENWILYFAPTETVGETDFVVMDGLEYFVNLAIPHPEIAGEAQMIVAYVERSRLQVN